MNFQCWRGGGVARCVFGIALILALSRTAGARAAALSWSNAAGGSASIAGNWNPAQIPAAADDLTFNLAGTYAVTFNNVVTTSRTHTYRNGTVTITASTPHTATNGVTIGSLAGDTATMTFTTGDFTSSSAVTVANASGSTGTLNVNDDDADFTTSGGADMTIGAGGNGGLNITGGGLVEVSGEFIAGANSTSTASVLVSGFTIAPIAVSSLEVLGVGESRIGAGGDVTMTIDDGAAASFAGDLIIANGSASTSSITVQEQGLLNARLIVDGDLLIGRNSGGAAAGTGTLFLEVGGETDIGGATFLGDPQGGTGIIDLNGGLFGGDGDINVLTGSSIVGEGTIDANIANGGAIQPSGAGLTLNGILSNTTNNVVGTKIHFGSAGGYTGSGSCQTDIAGDSTAQITATGTLSLGRNTTSGVSYNGQIDVNSRAVTLVDSNGAVLGGLTTMNGGSLACANGVGLANGGRIQGAGTVNGITTVSGVLDPQRSGTPGGLITVQGNLLMNPSGVFDMDLGGTPASGNNDRCNVTGSATFGGTLRVRLPTGFVPRVGEQFIAINATLGRVDEFDAIQPPNPPPCNDATFVLVYSSTAAIVLVRPPLGCTALGDLNSDGGCDGLDIQPFVDIALSHVYDGCADLNGDCSVDAGDVPILVNCLL